MHIGKIQGVHGLLTRDGRRAQEAMDTEEEAAASAQSMEQLEVEGGAQVTIPCAHVTRKNARKISVVHGFCVTAQGFATRTPSPPGCGT